MGQMLNAGALRSAPTVLAIAIAVEAGMRLPVKLTRLVHFEQTVEEWQFVASFLDAILEHCQDRSRLSSERIDKQLRTLRSPSTLSTMTGVALPLFGRMEKFTSDYLNRLDLNRAVQGTRLDAAQTQEQAAIARQSTLVLQARSELAIFKRALEMTSRWANATKHASRIHKNMTRLRDSVVSATAVYDAVRAIALSVYELQQLCRRFIEELENLLSQPQPTQDRGGVVIGRQIALTARAVKVQLLSMITLFITVCGGGFWPQRTQAGVNMTCGTGGSLGVDNDRCG